MSAAEAAVIGSDPARLEQFFRETSGRTDVEFGEWIYHTAHRRVPFLVVVFVTSLTWSSSGPISGWSIPYRRVEYS